MVASRLLRTPDHFMTVFKLIRTFAFILLLLLSLLHKKEPRKATQDQRSLFHSLAKRGPALMSGQLPILPSIPKIPTCGMLLRVRRSLEDRNACNIPIFDNYGSYSIGCVTVDPSQNNIVWVGTGENVGGRHVGYGYGIYRSSDGGKSFKKMGLEKSEHLSKILVHPRNPNLVYVASQGPLWSSGGERGLYMTRDGGKTWDLVLSKGKWTGVTDVVMDPKNPSILYAATHQRHRTVWSRLMPTETGLQINRWRKNLARTQERSTGR